MPNVILLKNRLNMDFIKPYGGNPQDGHLSTPISDSAIVKAFIGNLPAYRPGLSPLLRGVEIGMAHGYFLVGPEAVLGPLRDYQGAANFGGLVFAVTIVVIGAICLAAHGLVTFNTDNSSSDPLKTAEGWSQFAAGFFLGGAGGAFFAYFLLENLSGVNAMLSGLVN